MGFFIPFDGALHSPRTYPDTRFPAEARAAKAQIAHRQRLLDAVDSEARLFGSYLRALPAPRQWLQRPGLVLVVGGNRRWVSVKQVFDHRGQPRAVVRHGRLRPGERVPRWWQG